VTPQETYTDIHTIIRMTIEAGLSDEQRYPAMKKVGRRDYDIYIQDAPDLSASMKHRPYDEIYDDLSRSGAFNLRMIDGALVQMLYTFREDDISSHRLSVFPSPNLDIYEDAQEAYEEDQIFADIVGRHIVRFPVRFDFSSDDKAHVDVEHPKSHLTLGQYTNCRIPVSSPLTPTRFMSFVLRSFYNPAFGRFKFGDDATRASFSDTITTKEKAIGHFIS
jgi:hypothetical protein